MAGRDGPARAAAAGAAPAVDRNKALNLPTYEYQTADPKHACDHCRTRFEVRQSMRDQPLAACPQCGGKIDRLISACGISTTPSGRAMLSDKNLKSKGFTKLVNEGGGKFRRVT